MTLFALGLVSAFFHAIWNLLAKRAGSAASGPAFVWPKWRPPGEPS